MAIAADQHDLCVFIGRMSPPHLGHLAVIRQALRSASRLLIILGSADAARRFDYVPFTADERAVMIRLMLTAEENSRVVIVPVEDQGNLPKWTGLVRQAANAICPTANIALVGHAKDRSSYYLRAFPGWESVDVENFMALSATTFRNDMFGGSFMAKVMQPHWHMVHPEVRDWLVDFSKMAPFDYMVRESAFVVEYQKKWGKGPFLTADLVCIQGDYVLTIERDRMPFEGLIAAPGGFVEPDERVVDAAFREGGEETGLKVPEQVLRRSIIGTKYYDDPFRDPRGRVLTFATTVYLNPEPPQSMIDPNEIRKFLKLPRIRAGDDARTAEWRHIPSIKRQNTSFDFFNMLQDSLEMLPKNS